MSLAAQTTLACSCRRYASAAAWISASRRFQHIQIRRSATQEAAPRIGLIGLGNLGQAIAKNILRSGTYSLAAALDGNPKTLEFLPNDVARVTTPAELAEVSDVVITAVALPSDVKSVFQGKDGVLAGLNKNSVWIDHTTTDYEQTLQLAQDVENKGAFALEAPLTGGMALLQQGLMTTLVGGQRAAFDRCRPIFEMSCANVLYMGPIGSATITKVVSNMLAGAHVVLMGEALMMAKKSGVDLKAFFDGIRLSAGSSYAFETEAPLVFNGSCDPNFHIKLHCKDFGLGYEIARKYQAPIPVHAAVQQIYDTARLQYGEKAGSTHPARLTADAIGESLEYPGYEDWTYEIQTLKGGSFGVVHKKKDK